MPKIFCANAGRSGSAFVAGALGHLTGIPSFHEPFPRLIGRVLEEVNDDRISAETKRVIEAKIVEIERASRDGWYCETSQQFIKCFAEFALAAWDDVYCIYIHRNPLDVIMSYFRHLDGSYPDEWLLKPEWKKNLVKIREPLSWAELLLFNWLEVRERYLSLKPRFTKVYELDFMRIGNKTEYIKMFEHFELEWHDGEIAALWKNGSKSPRDTDAQIAWIRKVWNEPGRPGGFITDYDWLSGQERQ